MAMEHTPLKTVDDKFAAGRICAVCGESALKVVHVENLPDYVECANCDSAFILSEASDWAMFGSVSSEYPETGRTVLKRWTTLEAVQNMAGTERDPKNDAVPIEDPESEPTPPFGIGGDGAASLAAEQATTPPFGLGELDDFVAESANGNSVPASVLSLSEPMAEAADVAEPEPGHRYVVTLAQRTAVLPAERCAHCLRRPAPRKLLVARSSEPDLGYQVPLCQSCHARASVQSEERKTAKLIAHLSSILIAGVLIVGSLAAGWVNLQDPGVVDLVLVATLGLVGYGLPAVLLLRRSSRLPPSEDAQFVRSTLRVRDDERLAFGWRNRGYAELFSTANADLLLGELTRISEDPSRAS